MLIRQPWPPEGAPFATAADASVGKVLIDLHQPAPVLDMTPNEAWCAAHTLILRAGQLRRAYYAPGGELGDDGMAEFERGPDRELFTAVPQVHWRPREVTWLMLTVPRWLALSGQDAIELACETLAAAGRGNPHHLDYLGRLARRGTLHTVAGEARPPPIGETLDWMRPGLERVPHPAPDYRDWFKVQGTGQYPEGPVVWIKRDGTDWRIDLAWGKDRRVLSYDEMDNALAAALRLRESGTKLGKMFDWPLSPAEVSGLIDRLKSVRVIVLSEPERDPPDIVPSEPPERKVSYPPDDGEDWTELDSTPPCADPAVRVRNADGAWLVKLAFGQSKWIVDHDQARELYHAIGQPPDGPSTCQVYGNKLDEEQTRALLFKLKAFLRLAEG